MICDLVRLIFILHNLQNKNLQNLLEDSILCNFSMIESAQQLTKSDSNHYVIVLSDLGWLILFCVI